MTEETRVEIEVLEAWPGGPLREFCKTRPRKSWGIPHASGRYANRYVCSACKKPVSGVYEPEWLCSACRSLSAKNPYLQVAKTGIPARYRIAETF